MTDQSNAESIMHEVGTVAVIADRSALSRTQKDVVRAALADPASGITAVGNSFVLAISEEPHVDPDHVCDDNDDCEFHEYQGPKAASEPDGGEPTMEDLKALTVAALKDLAAKESVDLSGLTLKDDILGRMAAHFGLDPAA